MRSKRPLRRTSRERWRKSGQIHFEPGETLLHKTRAAAQRERTPNPQDFLLIGSCSISGCRREKKLWVWFCFELRALKWINNGVLRAKRQPAILTVL